MTLCFLYRDEGKKQDCETPPSASERTHCSLEQVHRLLQCQNINKCQKISVKK